MARTGTCANPASSFTAMILAGGAGTRLRGVVADRCKPMALVQGEPFVVRLLDQLAAAGCRRVILCTGVFGEQVERELGTEHAGMAVCYSRELHPLGTGGALRQALPLLDDDASLVLNGDSFVDTDLAPFVAWARERDAALLAVPVEDASRFGTVTFDAGGRVLEFAEKRPGGRGWISAGIYWFDRCVLAARTADTPCSLETDVLPAVVLAGLMAFRVHAPFLDIGTPDSYAAAEAFFAACATRRARDRKGLLVVDRDGTLIAERHYLADPAAVELLPGVVDGLRAFVANGYEVAIVTNQSGVGRGYFDAEALRAVNHEVERQLAEHGIPVRGTWVCPHRPDEGCACRKPEPLLLDRALRELGYLPSQCLMVGDKKCDIDLGARRGVRTALVRTGYGSDTERDGLCAPDLIVDGLHELALQEVGP